MRLGRREHHGTWAGHCKTANGPGDAGSCELRTLPVPVTQPSPPVEPWPAVGRTFPFLAMFMLPVE